jgi:hypothetical protein
MIAENLFKRRDKELSWLLAEFSVSVMVNYSVLENENNKVKPKFITHIIINA